MTKILHLEDNPLDARLIKERLLEEDLNPKVMVVSSESGFIKALKTQTFDIILADYYLPGFDGITALQIVREIGIDLPVILISGKLGEEAAVESLKKGAVDYILKDNLQRLGPAVKRALEEHSQQLHTQKVEKELIKSAALFGKIESIAQLGTFEWNYETGDLYWSEGLYQIFHYQKEEITPTTQLYLNHVVEEDRDTVRQSINDTVNHGSDINAEYRIRTHDGVIKYLRTFGTVLSGEDGSAPLLIGVCQDSTQSVHARNRLEKSEEKYRTLVEQATDGILISDQELRILEANQSALHILECLDSDQLIGQFPESFLTPTEISRNPIDRSNILKHPVTNVREVNTFENNHKYLEITSNSIPGRRVQIVFRDVTERETTRIELEKLNRELDERVREAVAEAQENESRYRLISENSSDLITQSEKDGTLTYVSPSSKEILGCHATDYLNRTFCELIPGPYQELWQQTLGELNDGNKGSITFEHEIFHSSGKTLWVETVCKAIRNENGQVQTYQTASRDIHVRKQAEQDTRKAIERERELNDLRSQFVSMASHQFRTPLTVINSNIELMKLQGLNQFDPRVNKILDRITRETSRLTELMNDVLILGKLNARRLDTNPEQVDITELVDRLKRDHVSSQPNQRCLDIRIEGPPPPVTLDISLTEHVLSNLIDNAFKYSPEEKNPELSFERTRDSLIISVRDWGIGVPEADREHLFESFYRGQNTQEFPGTGLGLVIAREFMELQNGRIGYRPAEDRGSIFWISFQLERARALVEE